jgi:hypothetical protein
MDNLTALYHLRLENPRVRSKILDEKFARPRADSLGSHPSDVPTASPPSSTPNKNRFKLLAAPLAD